MRCCVNGNIHEEGLSWMDDPTAYDFIHVSDFEASPSRPGGTKETNSSRSNCKNRQRLGVKAWAEI